MERQIPMPDPQMPLQRTEPAQKAREPHDVKALHQTMGYVEYEPSASEKRVLEVLAETKSFKVACATVNKEFGRRYRVEGVKRWITERLSARSYLAKLLKDQGMAELTKNEWMALMIDIAKNDRRINSTTPMMYKLIGEAKGYFPSKGEGSGVNISGDNIKVNILQADGRA